MSTMADGKPRLPNGTYIRFAERGIEQYGRIVGTDLGGSKYEVGARYGGWGEWRFLDGGSWVLLDDFEVVSDLDAQAIREVKA